MAGEPDIESAKIAQASHASLADGELIHRWHQGDQQAAAVLNDRYFVRLIALVASRLNRRYQGAIDPEEVVQSAMGSFFAAAGESRLAVSDSVGLFRLLSTFAKRKMLRRIEREQASKRGGDRKRVPLTDADSIVVLADPANQDDSVRDLATELKSELPEELRRTLDLALAGLNRQQMADRLKIDARTVRRRLAKIRQSLDPDSTAPRTAQDRAFHSESLPRIDYREFVLGRLVASGGFGKVYRASMQSNGALVAAKFLRKGFWQDADARDSFLREIEAASQINDPRIIRYLGWGQSPHGAPYVLSEWIDGQALVHHPTIPPELFRQHLRHIIDAVGALHHEGVVHGDLTPSNILITEENRMVVADFGFARIRAARERARNEIRLGGTPGFAAPEQVSAAFGAVSAATDFYGLGGLAFWYLAGHPPHLAESREASLASTISAADVDTDRLSAESSATAAIKRVAQATLRKAIADRPKTAEEITALL